MKLLYLGKARDPICLPINNLQRDEDENLANAYQGVIEKYLSKGHIRQVPISKPEPESEWFLPHLPVIRPDRATTKVRIIFDVSAKFQEKGLNTEALSGSKRQNNIFDILVRFGKELEVLVGDISWFC